MIHILCFRTGSLGGFVLKKGKRHWIGERRVSSGKRMGQKARGEYGKKDTLYPLPSCSCQTASLVPTWILSISTNPSELVQIISLYLTALVSWLMKGKANQSLTAQNLEGTFYKAVPWGMGTGLSTPGHLLGSTADPGWLPGHKAICRNYKPAQLCCQMNSQPCKVMSQQDKILWQRKEKRGGVRDANWFRKPWHVSKTFEFLQEKWSKQHRKPFRGGRSTLQGKHFSAELKTNTCTKKERAVAMG